MRHFRRKSTFSKAMTFIYSKTDPIRVMFPCSSEKPDNKPRWRLDPSDYTPILEEIMKHRLFCWTTPAYAGYSHAKAHKRHSDAVYETRWHGRGASFGVRRPLRYLAHRLDLDENQVRRLAAVLNQLKTESEQASLDEKRSVTGLANLLLEGTPTLDECKEQLAARVKTAEHMRDETAKATVAICSLLDEDQRAEFVDLLLAGDFRL